jgi:hypothetical protein
MVVRCTELVMVDSFYVPRIKLINGTIQSLDVLLSIGGGSTHSGAFSSAWRVTDLEQ